MKNIFLLYLSLAFVMISCEGDPGPPGPPGRDGIDFLGQVFETNEIDLNLANDFSALIEFPPNIEVFDTDVVVAYILAEVDDGLDIWEPLPLTLSLDGDILLYKFDYSTVDVQLFLDGNVVFENLPPNYTDDLIFRIAVLPADFAEAVDLNNMESLMEVLRHNKVIYN